ncbi:MAG: FtsX-like permease family protein [Rhodoferax sp.]|nr:MAG: FtsX-like permease family protein [Rhodoferax sp.]
MRSTDLIRFARDAATGNPLRAGLLVLAMAIGVASVVVLTALGDGARRYVMNEFSSLGSNLVIVLPGRSQTGGFNPGNAVTSTPRDLTIDDAQSLLRLSAVARAAPLTVGTSEIRFEGRLREVMVAGTTAEYAQVRQMAMAQGRFLAAGDWRNGAPEAVIGAKVRSELFGNQSALGQLVRVGDRRFRVVGVLSASGQGLGMNNDELVLIPVSLAQAMFNTSTLFRILVEAKGRESMEAAKTQVAALIQTRHEGEQDVTVITQDAVLATFDKLLGALTLGVAGIAAISLAVAGILVMNVMLVSVTQRTSEIGLLKALGADTATIRNVFLMEAAMLSLAGALVGYGLGLAAAGVIRQIYPTFPAYAPEWAVLAGLGTALVTGIVFGVLPARRAARLDPVAALAKR